MQTELQRKRSRLDSKRMELKIEEKECDLLQLEERAKALRSEIEEMKAKVKPLDN